MKQFFIIKMVWVPMLAAMLTLTAACSGNHDDVLLPLRDSASQVMDADGNYVEAITVFSADEIDALLRSARWNYTSGVKVAYHDGNNVIVEQKLYDPSQDVGFNSCEFTFNEAFVKGEVKELDLVNYSVSENTIHITDGYKVGLPAAWTELKVVGYDKNSLMLDVDVSKTAKAPQGLNQATLKQRLRLTKI